MSDEEDIAALVIDNGSGMCKGKKERRRNGSEVLTKSDGVVNPLPTLSLRAD
jgi:hypothetical protein